ncbi:major facilitator superfamily [Heterobasidion irregulare TC 32-1]|uniref:Major facilitator superfamily n=1 Tax=Heterobasidion irregulare (strain TC 32-1) TaxID=747525 RepID=W4K801_HETIT|nr:major facilitator superfamily [Heterobasidion irregulare TC 32-1]ETW81874.1 major facilitator superfamily [Heterobasidion irregulare TC 32-1]
MRGCRRVWAHTGSYQWTLLSLCGFGWMADNMWIQAVAIILPRVQIHYSGKPEASYIGTLSSSMFAGMMFGAIGWGTCSDLMGRSAAFNATLFFTAVFGLVASFANTFGTLCLCLFLLGSSVGGSMPTDGTLLLEHMPRGKEYLVTALSVFFSFGAVLSALVAIVLVPKHSCPPAPAACDVAIENLGWKYELMALGLITLTMFLARMVFFRLHESPRYLVHAGRHQEALESLQMISRFNGDDFDISLYDVDDSVRDRLGENTPFLSPPHDEDSHLLSASAVVQAESPVVPEPDADTDAAASHPPPARPRPRPPRSESRASRTSVTSSIFEGKGGWLWWKLPRWIRRPLGAWLDRFAMVLAPEWIRTTVVVWGVWFGMSLGYTMFNVYLPKLLEARNSAGAAPKSLEGTLWDVVIFTIGGCPGAVLGAYLIESPLGRRLSLAGSTFVTAVFCIIFAMVDGQFAVTASTVGISLSATAMWAVLYGWTPEIFSTKVRGTACGTASALSRIGGMIAPILGGTLLMVNTSFPVYTSICVFTLSGVAVLLLSEDAGDTKGREGGPVIVH